MDTFTKVNSVLYCHNDYATKKGGEYSVFNNDIKLLEEHGYKVIRYEKNNDELFQDNIFKKIYSVFSSFFNFKVYSEIKNIVEKEKIEYAFVQNTYLILSPAIYLALYRKRVPIIQMIYNYRFMCANAHLFIKSQICERCIGGAHYNAVLNKCLRNSYFISIWYASILFISKKLFRVEKKISAFVVPDEFSKKKHVQASIKEEKIFVAKNPFSAVTYEDNENNEGFFLFIGRLIRQKGIYTFLESAKALREIEFKIIGEGEEEINIAEFIDKNALENIAFLGPLYGPEMSDVLKNARALIVPSEWYDNYPVVISLAYNYSKPVIATNINGLSEVVIDNKTGLLFDLKNVADLCKKINYLADNLNRAKELGINGKLFLTNELNEGKRINIIEDVLTYVAKYK